MGRHRLIGYLGMGRMDVFGLIYSKLAGEEGFEPSHAGIKIQCLNQLGDSPTGHSEEIKL